MGSVAPTRCGGADRYETSLRIAEAVATEAGGSLSSVVLVSGERWTDAVVAAPIAGSLGAPVLMTPPDELPAGVASYLDTSGVSHVVLMGGTGSHTDPCRHSCIPYDRRRKSPAGLRRGRRRR